MTAPLDEQILSLVVSKLAGITVGNGYQTAMVAGRIHRPAVGELEFDADDADQVPALTVRRAARVSRWHIRGAEEFTLKVAITAIAATYDAALVLMSDVLKLVSANEAWNNGSSNLAVRSWIEENDAPDFDVESNLHYGHILVAIKSFADLTNPTVVKAI
jgi:hypothetical protein